MAEGVGFEPTEVLPSTVFKTAAFNHSAIPPQKTHFTTIFRNSGQYILTRKLFFIDILFLYFLCSVF